MRAAAKEEADRHAKEQNPLYHLIGPGNLVRDTYSTFNTQNNKGNDAVEGHRKTDTHIEATVKLTQTQRHEHKDTGTYRTLSDTQFSQHIRVNCAMGLPKMDTSGACDAYVKVKLDGQKHLSH